jgi:hypothetical protein
MQEGVFPCVHFTIIITVHFDFLEKAACQRTLPKGGFLVSVHRVDSYSKKGFFHKIAKKPIFFANPEITDQGTLATDSGSAEIFLF